MMAFGAHVSTQGEVNPNHAAADAETSVRIPAQAGSRLSQKTGASGARLGAAEPVNTAYMLHVVGGLTERGHAMISIHRILAGIVGSQDKIQIASELSRELPQKAGTSIRIGVRVERILKRKLACDLGL